MKKQKIHHSFDGLTKIMFLIMACYILLAPIDWVRLGVFFLLTIIAGGIEAVPTGE